MTPPIVQLEDVTKRYRDLEALSGVSFHLSKGEVFGYLGPSGAGKTTTLKILAGLLTKFEGKVRVDGKSLPDRRDEVHESIGGVIGRWDPELAAVFEDALEQLHVIYLETAPAEG